MILKLVVLFYQIFVSHFLKILAFFEKIGQFWEDHQKCKEYVRLHHYVPQKLLQSFVEPVNSLIFIFCTYFLEHCALEYSLVKISISREVIYYI